MTAALAKRATEPVRAYLACARLAWIDDVDGFASRFTAGAAIERAAGEAMLPFRRAVVRALLSEVREARKSTGACSGCDCKQPCETPLDPQAFEAFERAWAGAVIAEASQRAARASHAENDADAWEIYRRTALEGAETAALARERGITTADARTRAARAAARFDAAIRETLSEEGIAADAIDDELAWLMDAALR
ncbi:MAG: hypothetical protein NTU45_04385 [Planctomycetota bacterium]|nr:hypothetical protein [Planctomycetota bacterium]